MGKYVSKTELRIARPRSKRLRELGGNGNVGISSTVVSVDGTSSVIAPGDGHTHLNKAMLDEISTDDNRYLYLTKLEESDDGTYESVIAKAKAGHADEATHAVAADEATHAAKAHDVDEDSPVYDKFLRKDVADEAAKMITFLEGLFVGRKGHGISVDAAGSVTAIFDELKNIFSLASPAFVSGDLGSGFTLSQDPQTGESYLEVDRMLVRKLAYFVELVIKRLSYVGGEIILTPASMKCTKVEELPTCYRCYFEQDDGQKSIKQEFRAGDQARAQTFNIKEGTSHHASNKYYWRLVEAVGINYIDLSKTDCDAGSGLPEAGDEIVQLGNRTDATRQNAIILSTVGDDAPSIKQYKGINAYALAGKEVTILSPTLNKIIGQFISEATGKSFDEIIQAVQVDLDLIKEQTDKEYTIWFFEYIPTLTNIPASNWTTNELKTLHEQDMFYNRDSGLAYRFVKSGSTWEWAEITDQQTLKALENAAKAQDTADGKRRVFVAQPTTEDAYDVGDMWVNATYGELYDNDSLVCRTAKAAGEDFSIEHWKSASNATTAYIKNLGDSILVVSEKFNADGSLKNTSGLVTGDGNFATLFANAVNADGNIVKQADISVFMTEDAVGNKISNASIKADKIVFEGTSVKIKSQYLDLTGAVTFNSFSNDLQATINAKADANSLGALAKLNTIEKANLGTTLINGGYLKTELIDVDNLYVKHINGGTGDFTGNVVAQSGKIGYFSIDSQGLYFGDPTKWEDNNYKQDLAAVRPGLIKIQSQDGYFVPGDIANIKVAIGNGADPTSKDSDSSCSSAGYFYRQMNPKSEDSYYIPAVKIISDNVANRNVALYTEGAVICHGGLMSAGYFLNADTVNVLDFSFGSTVLIYNTTAKRTIFLPTLDNMKLLMNATGVFCVDICLLGRYDITQNYTIAFQPGQTSLYFRDSNGGKYADAIPMGAGDVLKIILIYDGSNYYAQLSDRNT